MKARSFPELITAARKFGGAIIRRLTGKAEVEELSATKSFAAKAGKTATYDEALATTRSMSQSIRQGPVDAARFEQQGMDVLGSAHANILAGDIARSTAKAMADQPNSNELFRTLVKSHKQLDTNISRRKAQSRLIQDREELTTLHTQNVQDARTLIETGARGPLRDDAFKDIAEAMDRLHQLDPQAAQRLTREMLPNRELTEGVTRAARQLTERTEREAAQAVSARAAIALDDRARATERLHNLGVIPSIPAPPATDPQTSAVQAYARILTDRSRTTPPAIAGLETHEVDMSVFRAAEAEASRTIGKAKTNPAPATTQRPTTTTPE